MTICLKSSVASGGSSRKLKYFEKKRRRSCCHLPIWAPLSPFHLLHKCTTDACPAAAAAMHVTGGNGRQAFPSPGDQVIEFWLRTRGVQSLGNLQISRWLLIGLRQAHRDPLKTLAWPKQLFTERASDQSLLRG